METANPGCRLRDQVLWEDVETVRLLTESSGFFSAQEVEIAMSLVVERLEFGESCGYYFLFAQGPDSCLGFACYGPYDDRPEWFDLYWIAVSDELRGQGVGRLLLSEVVRRVRDSGGRLLRAETSGRAQYGPTRKFYERNGFVHTRTDRDHYAEGDDRCIYDKQLSAPFDARESEPTGSEEVLQ